MNCIKDGKYSGDSCFGCPVKVDECEIRDKVYRKRWIPVDERLPEIGEPVLITLWDKDVSIGSGMGIDGGQHYVTTRMCWLGCFYRNHLVRKTEINKKLCIYTRKEAEVWHDRRKKPIKSISGRI